MSNQLRWLDVWERNGDKGARLVTPTLSDLLTIDGYNTGFGDVGVGAWEAFVAGVFTTLGAKHTSSVFEVGCGSGAFLVPRYRNGAHVAGVDYARSLIKIATKVMPGGEFEVAEAVDFRTSRTFDFAVSCSTMTYFPDRFYAARVLARMLTLSRRGVAVLDLPDAAWEKEDLASRRAEFDDLEEYSRRYSGLERLYFDREWVRAVLIGAGASRVELADQDIVGYKNGAFRFNAYAWLDR